MRAIQLIKRKKYSTIRQLETLGYAIIKPLGIIAGVGLLLCFTTILMALGVFLLGVSLLGMGMMFTWLIHLQKQPHRDIYCPYCTNPNSVFKSATLFDCDFCERPIKFDPSGVPIPADEQSVVSEPKSIYGS